MDTLISATSGTNQHYTPHPLKTAADSFTPATQQAVTAAVQSTSTDTGINNSLSQQYETALRQAAISFKNVYALGDQDFSIFKDATGKYITRYVSLRDGKVTYIPELTLVKQLQLGGETPPAHLAISA